DDASSFSMEAKRLLSWVGVAGDDLTFELQDSLVSVSDKKGSIRLPSFDPSEFPFWDKVFSESEQTNKVSALLLRDGFSAVKSFISTDETNQPSLCVSEYRSGGFWSMDQVVLSLLEIDGLENCKLRIHGKNFGSLLSFLSLAEDEDDVQIYHHKNVSFFALSDGSLFGESRFYSEFPEIDFSTTGYNDVFDVSKEAVEEALRRLIPGAPSDEEHVELCVQDKSLTVSMNAVHGGIESMEVPLVGSFRNMGSYDGRGFRVSYKHLQKILSLYEENEVTISIRAQLPNGFLFFHREDERITHYMALIWKLAS
ncbi:MAG: hypothetical protein AAGM67_00370, partial [Bacteroidota bacterium]